MLFSLPQIYAATKEIRFQPMPKKGGEAIMSSTRGGAHRETANSSPGK
jgi:hypothetical protein